MMEHGCDVLNEPGIQINQTMIGHTSERKLLGATVMREAL